MNKIFGRVVAVLGSGFCVGRQLGKGAKGAILEVVLAKVCSLVTSIIPREEKRGM